MNNLQLWGMAFSGILGFKSTFRVGVSFALWPMLQKIGQTLSTQHRSHKGTGWRLIPRAITTKL
jgi:hypothetical protein